MTAFTAETLIVERQGAVAWLRLNRPDKGNALDLAMWRELPAALAWLNAQPEVRVVVIAGEGRHFCCGIDLSALSHLYCLVDAACEARGREKLLAFIEQAQAAFNAVETLRVPVIAAIHGGCLGAGVDLIAACDLRLAAGDARFSIKEVDWAVVPDVGTLQRLRHVIGQSALAELSYTGETFDAGRALALGLVSRVCASKEQLWLDAAALAQTIAAKSPLTVRGIKRNLLWSRDHNTADGLAYVAAWNASMVVSADGREALAAANERRSPVFDD